MFRIMASTSFSLRGHPSSTPSGSKRWVSTMTAIASRLARSCPTVTSSAKSSAISETHTATSPSESTLTSHPASCPTKTGLVLTESSVRIYTSAASFSSVSFTRTASRAVCPCVSPGMARTPSSKVA
jgi:hypothetical protein